MKRTLFVLISIMMVGSMLLTACGGATATTVAVPPTAPPTAKPPTAVPPTAVPTPAGTLVIWADDTRTPILQGMADAFLADYNVELVVEDLGVVQDIRSQA
ncbi:MAG: hypothetical protein NTV38_03505, partial [Chloroflexi bacterium]|nr:hypothetical protein [Chloroflexota bacterium]